MSEPKRSRFPWWLFLFPPLAVLLLMAGLVEAERRWREWHGLRGS